MGTVKMKMLECFLMLSRLQEFVEGVNYALRSAGGQQGPAMALTR